MKNPWIVPVVTLLVGAVGGYLAGNRAEFAKSTSEAEVPLARTRSSLRGEAANHADPASKRSHRASGIMEISRIPGNNNRVQAMMDFYANLTPDELEAEARKLETLPIRERMMGSFLLFGRWAEVDPTAAMAFSNTMGFGGGFIKPTILQSWASVDPAGAAKYYTQNPREFQLMAMMAGGRGPMGGLGGAGTVASEWAKVDPAAALAWANTLTTEKSQALSAVLGEVAKSDPKKATEMLGSVNNAELGDAYQAIASEYGALNFAEAQSWIRTLPSGERDDVLAAAVRGLSVKDPAEAARQVDQMAQGEARNSLVPAIARDLGRSDPQAAADFLAAEGNQDVQREGMRQLIPVWVGQDPQAALTYANGLATGPVRDTALQSWLWSNHTSPPATLIQVAEGISGEQDRSRAIGLAASRWMREDPEGARAYVESSAALSDGAKKRIIEGRGMWDGGWRGRGRGRN